MPARLKTVILGTTVLAAGLAAHGPALAQDASQLNAIEAQIKALQAELRALKGQMATKDAQVRAAREQAEQARQSATQATQASQAAARATVAPPQIVQPGLSYVQTGVAEPVIPGASVASTPLGGEPKAPEAKKGTFVLNGVTVTLGGFLAGETAYRTVSQSSDIASNFGAIPFSQVPYNHEPEIRFSARQTRLTLLAFADIEPGLRATGYVETDFLGAAPTANANESNSYNLRMRHLFGSLDYDDAADDVGLHFLAGQTWSLGVMNKSGIEPLQTQIPQTIDPQYTVGFLWARQDQIRISADIAEHRLWGAISIENPQTTFTTSGYTAAATTAYPAAANGLVLPTGPGLSGGFANVNNPGVALVAPTVNYSNNYAPDVWGKLTADPGFGHYELYGVARFFSDRVDSYVAGKEGTPGVGSGHNNTRLAGGGGAAAGATVIPETLDLYATFLGGYGIGRYGTGQLSDATIKPNGDVAPLPEYIALAGAIYHPVPSVDVYGYLGTEQVGKTAFTVGSAAYGYGSPLFVNTGCNTELSTAKCIGNTSGLIEATLGYWWRPYKGPFGTVQTGLQASWIDRQAFKGATNIPGVSSAPKVDEDLIELSFRYYPFQ